MSKGPIIQKEIKIYNVLITRQRKCQAAGSSETFFTQIGFEEGRLPSLM